MKATMQCRYGKKRFLGIMIMVSAAFLLGCGTKPEKGDDTVMNINGQEVAKEEFQMILSDYESQVKSRYSTDEANSRNFWQTETDGESPLSQILQLTIGELVEKKVIAKMAADAGIDTAADYVSIVEQMENTNNARGNGTLSGTSSYGLTFYELEDYYSYIYTGLESALIENLRKKHTVSEEELKRIYDADKEQYTSDVSVKMLIGELRTETGMELAEEVAEEIRKNTDTESLLEKYSDVNFYELSMSSLDTQEGKSGAYTQRWTVASMMRQGEVCAPFQIGDHIMVMRCLKRSENAVQPFDDIKGVLESEVSSRLAKEEIEKEIKNAEIEYEEKDLEKAALEVLQN